MPWANGYVDYLKLVNARGGINGVKLTFEECETGYDTARGVECYERLKSKNGASFVFQPLSTGITFALTEKAPGDKIPLITAGYGRSEQRRWRVQVELPAGTYWVAATRSCRPSPRRKAARQAQGQEDRGLPRQPLRQGADPAAAGARQDARLRAAAAAGHGARRRRGQATWLQIRQNRPDYVFLWGWGVMNSTALKEAVATGYPRDKMYGVWWAVPSRT